MDPITRMVAASAAGAGGGDPTYVDDVFSTFLYEGNANTAGSQTINNGIDLSGEGGFVWIKRRVAGSHTLYDTERGATEAIYTTTDPESTRPGGLTSFNSNGFVVGNYTDENAEGQDLASWTFRKAPGFFDIVTYTGNGVLGRNISHNLGSAPGMIMVKKTSGSGAPWVVYHRGTGANYYLNLDNTNAAAYHLNSWNLTEPTSTVFTVGNSADVNGNGDSYLAYIFAHDDQSFGTNSDESIIKCGSFTCDSNGLATIDLGFEPQFLITKRADSTSQWDIVDSMRGLTTNKAGVGNIDNALLRANLANAELKFPQFGLTSTGFLTGANIGPNANYIYIAIRRPHKPPTAGTEVFAPQTTTPETVTWTPGFAPDALLSTKPTGANKYMGARLTGASGIIQVNGTSAELTGTDYFHWDEPTGKIRQTAFQSSSDTGLHYAFKRAPGFFDVVAYTGNGADNHQISHNLGVVPEFALFKERKSSDPWVHFHDMNASTYFYSFFNTGPGGAQSYGSGYRMFAQPNATTLFLTDYTTMNQNTQEYIVYLFASLSGISKVGSYSGTGSNVDVDCGFTAGARFVMIKRTDSTGDWYVWDTARGIVSGNDPYIILNSTAAVTNTDYIDPLNAGFTVTSSAPAALNTSGGTYLFLAIA